MHSQGTDETRALSPSSPTCKGKKKDGSACEAPPGDNGYCWWHSPAVSWEERYAAVTRGGMAKKNTGDPSAPNPKLRTKKDRVAFLEQIAGAVLRGELEKNIANSLGFVAMNAGRDTIGSESLELRRGDGKPGASITVNVIRYGAEPAQLDVTPPRTGHLALPDAAGGESGPIVEQTYTDTPTPNNGNEQGGGK